MSAVLVHITPTARSLEAAGLRLDLAQSIMDEITKPGRDISEEEFGKAEAELFAARRRYRALFELRTGLGWETAARRLSL